jgi:hypothetical protein
VCESVPVVHAARREAGQRRARTFVAVQLVLPDQRVGEVRQQRQDHLDAGLLEPLSGHARLVDGPHGSVDLALVALDERHEVVHGRLGDLDRAEARLLAALVALGLGWAMREEAIRCGGQRMGLAGGERSVSAGEA